MKQYYPDPELKRKLQRTQYKKHPKWNKRKWVRRILILFGILFGIYSGISIPADTLIEKIVLNYFCMGFLGCIPYLAYRKALEGSCECVVNYREHDTVVITDEDIKYIYHPSNQYNINIFQQLETRYENITRMIYNTYHHKIDIYGKRREIWYCDYSKGKYTRNKNVNKPDTRIRLYLYFEGNEEILKTLEEKSGVQMEKRDYSEE